MNQGRDARRQFALGRRQDAAGDFKSAALAYRAASVAFVAAGEPANAGEAMLHMHVAACRQYLAVGSAVSPWEGSPEKLLGPLKTSLEKLLPPTLVLIMLPQAARQLADVYAEFGYYGYADDLTHYATNLRRSYAGYRALSTAEQRSDRLRSAKTWWRMTVADLTCGYGFRPDRLWLMAVIVVVVFAVVYAYHIPLPGIEGCPGQRFGTAVYYSVCIFTNLGVAGMTSIDDSGARCAVIAEGVLGYVTLALAVGWFANRIRRLSGV